MKLRTIVAILIVTVIIVAGLTWRGAFAYQDHLFGFMSEETAAYVHLSITPTIRRAISEKIKGSDPFISRDIREIAIAYTPSASPPYTVLVGTKSGNTPAGISGDARMDVVVIDLRNNPTPASHPQPLSVWVRPGRLAPAAPNMPVAAIAPLLPETITLKGFIDRWGLVLRTDGRWSRPAPRASLSLVRALRSGTVQAFNIPLDAFFAGLDVPMITDIAAMMPKSADVAVGLPHSDFTIRFEAPRVLPTNSIALLRGLLSRIWPITEQRTLDGIRSDVLVANANAISIRSLGGSLWEVNHAQRAEPLFHAWRQGEDIVASTSTSFGDVFFEAKPTIHIPTRCDLDEQRRLFSIGSFDYSQMNASAWSIAIDPVVGNLAICLMPTDQIIEKSAPLKENPFVDKLFTIFEQIR